MPRNSKSKSTKAKKQEGPVEDIKEGAGKMSASAGKALSRAWTTVTGGKKSSSSRSKKASKTPARKGGSKAGTTPSRRTTTSRSTTAKKTTRTRTRKAAKLPILKVYRLK